MARKTRKATPLSESFINKVKARGGHTYKHGRYYYKYVDNILYRAKGNYRWTVRQDLTPKEPTLYEHEFRNVEWPSGPSTIWGLLPSIMHDRKEWSTDSGSYMNVNDVWNQVNFDGLYARGEDGADHTNYEFFKTLVDEPDSPVEGVIFDPTDETIMFAVYEEEWAKVYSLPEDWRTSRKYFSTEP